MSTTAAMMKRKKMPRILPPLGQGKVIRYLEALTHPSTVSAQLAQ